LELNQLSYLGGLTFIGGFGDPNFWDYSRDAFLDLTDLVSRAGWQVKPMGKPEFILGSLTPFNLVAVASIRSHFPNGVNLYKPVHPKPMGSILK
jgi:hypothetical protein